MSPEPVPGHPTPGMHIWGWMLPLELEWLGARAAEMDSVTEVGSLHGRSAFAIATACPGPVYCIDPWNDEHLLCLPSFMRQVGDVLANVVPVQGYSPAVIDQCALPDVDMTFIDGNHAWADIAGDVEGWLPKTRRLICGHDYQPDLGDAAGYPDVARFVDEHFDGAAYRPEGTAIWAVDL